MERLDKSIANRGIASRREVKAVSYTHLDVYKRQPLRSVASALQ